MYAKKKKAIKFQTLGKYQVTPISDESRTYIPILKWWAFSLALIHFSLFVGTLVYTIMQRNEIDIQGILYLDDLNLDGDRLSEGIRNATSLTFKEVGDPYQLGWILSTFSIATATSHFVQFWFYRTERVIFISSVLQHRLNVVRWVEYSITAGLILWVEAQLSGVTNIFVLFSILVTNIALQLGGGLLTELLFSQRKIIWEWPAWLSFGVGCLLFIYQMAVVYTYFGMNAGSAPNWVQGSVYSLIFLYSLFGFNMLFFMPEWFEYSKGVRGSFRYELHYDILSLLTKTYLTLFIFIGASQ